MSRSATSRRPPAPAPPAEVAAYWLVQRDRRELSAEEESAFQSWLSADERHGSAYAKAKARWRLVTPTTDEPAALALRRSALSARRPKPWPLIAAGVAALVIVGVGYDLTAHHDLGRPDGETLSVAPASLVLETTRGEIRSFTLADGSILTLDTDTVAEVRLNHDRRNVVLSRGQAFFDVAHDPDRPFIVSAGERRVTALGTRFNVRLDGKGVEVLLADGRVDVRKPDGSEAVELHPGQRLTASGQTLSVLTAPDISSLPLWTEGRRDLLCALALNGFEAEYLTGLGG